MRFHNILNPLASQLYGIFHIHIIEEVYYPSHQLQQLEAAQRTKNHKFVGNKGRKHISTRELRAEPV